MELDRLSGSLGARVEGVRLAGVSPETLSALRDRLLEHKVLVIPGDVLDPGQLLAFAKGFGVPQVHPVVPHLEGFPGVIEIRNFGKAYTLNEHWHSDVMFEAEPPDLTILQARAVPAAGGDTLFANQTQAFDELSRGFKTLLSGLRAVHSGSGLAKVMGGAAAPEAVHPVVRTHPETGHPALYVCRAFTKRFEEMTAQESRPLLDYLYRWAVRTDFTCRVRWSPGDLVIWDNRCVQHYAVHDHGDAERVLYRVTVGASRPC